MAEDFVPCTMCGERAPARSCGCYEADYCMERDLDRSGA